MKNREQIYYKSGSTIPFFGTTQLILRVRRNFYIKGTTIETKQSGDNQYLIVETDNDTQRFIHYCIVSYYEKCAKGLFDVYLTRLAKNMKVSIDEVQVTVCGEALQSETLSDFTEQFSKLRKGETVWGNISEEKKTLQFDWKIAMLPMEIIEYLFLYELARFVHPAESDEFWQAIARRMPNYVMCRKWLEKHGNEYEKY